MNHSRHLILLAYPVSLVAAWFFFHAHALTQSDAIFSWAQVGIVHLAVAVSTLLLSHLRPPGGCGFLAGSLIGIWLVIFVAYSTMLGSIVMTVLPPVPYVFLIPMLCWHAGLLGMLGYQAERYLVRLPS